MDLYLKMPVDQIISIFDSLNFQVLSKKQHYEARFNIGFGRYHAKFALLDDTIYCDFHFDYTLHFMFLGVDFQRRPETFFTEKLKPLFYFHSVEYHTQSVNWLTQRNRAMVTGLKL